jgi:hypothetical protein
MMPSDPRAFRSAMPPSLWRVLEKGPDEQPSRSAHDTVLIGERLFCLLPLALQCLVMLDPVSHSLATAPVEMNR